jgi:hypothetical protein
MSAMNASASCWRLRPPNFNANAMGIGLARRAMMLIGFAGLGWLARLRKLTPA